MCECGFSVCVWLRWRWPRLLRSFSPSCFIQWVYPLIWIYMEIELDWVSEYLCWCVFVMTVCRWEGGQDGRAQLAIRNHWACVCVCVWRRWRSWGVLSCHSRKEWLWNTDFPCRPCLYPSFKLTVAFEHSLSAVNSSPCGQWPSAESAYSMNKFCLSLSISRWNPN